MEKMAKKDCAYPVGFSGRASIDPSDIVTYHQGAELLLPLVLELSAALEKALWCAENFTATSEEWQKKHYEAKQAFSSLARFAGVGESGTNGI